MRSLIVATLLLLVVGCGKSKPPTRSVNAPLGTGTALPTVVSTLPGALENDQSRSPAQWGEVLTTGDAKSRQLAGIALANLGKEGIPYLVQGMQSSSWEVRLTSLRAAKKDDMVANRTRTLPLLLNLAGDSNPQIAQYAVIRLGWFGPEGRAGMPMLLQKLSETADDPAAREEVIQAIVSVHDTVPLLAELVRHPNAILRKAAAVRLLGMAKNGMRIDAASNALSDRAANDPNPEVRSLAQAGLQRINGNPNR